MYPISNHLNRPDEQKKAVHNVVQILETVCPIVDSFLFTKYSMAATAGAYLFALCSTITFLLISTPYGNHLIGLLWFLNLAPLYDTIIHSIAGLLPNLPVEIQFGRSGEGYTGYTKSCTGY